MEGVFINLQLVEFLKNNPNDWEDILTENPYDLKITKSDNLVLFSYISFSSDFSLQIVRESRGIILEKDSWDIVCYPFEKFFNYGEEYASDIDFSSAVIEEKLDGSLIKLYNYANEWKVSTMNTIDAKNAELMDSSEVDNFYELFMLAKENSGLDFTKLNKNYTYLFELTSPYNRIVVPYDKPKLTHIGTRDNINLKELEDNIGVRKPKTYNFNSLDEVLKVTENMDYDKEGFVIRDKNYNRIKVKSPRYVYFHNKVSGVLTDRKILELIILGEDTEILSYFPEFEERFDKVKNLYDTFLEEIKYNLKEAEKRKKDAETRKEYALWAKEEVLPSILFSYYDNRVDLDNYVDYINNIDSKKLIEMIR